LQKDGTKATGPRSIFAKQSAPMKTTAKDEAYGAASMTAYMRVQFQISLSNAETGATTWCLADTEYFTMQLERSIYSFTLNDQKRFEKELSICLIKFESGWETIGIQAVRKTFE